MHRTNKLIRLAVAATLFVAGVASASTELEAEVAQLKQDVAWLKQQFLILNNNQRGIAQHVGLLKQPEQPTFELGTSHTQGNPAAKLVLVEFTDLHCPYCARFHTNTLPQLTESFISSNQLLFVNKHFPLDSIHPNARYAAQALECSAEQGKFSEAKAWLFKHGKAFSEASLSEFAQQNQLDAAQLSGCVDSDAIAEKIASDIALAKKLGIDTTPSFVIGTLENGKVHSWNIIKGAQSYDNFASVINDRLSEVK